MKWDIAITTRKDLTKGRFLSTITLQKTVQPSEITQLTSFRGVRNSFPLSIANISGDIWAFKVLDVSFERLRKRNVTYTKTIIKIEYDPQTHLTGKEKDLRDLDLPVEWEE